MLGSILFEQGLLRWIVAEATTDLSSDIGMHSQSSGFDGVGLYAPAAWPESQGRSVFLPSHRRGLMRTKQQRKEDGSAVVWVADTSKPSSPVSRFILTSWRPSGASEVSL